MRVLPELKKETVLEGIIRTEHAIRCARGNLEEAVTDREAVVRLHGFLLQAVRFLDGLTSFIDLQDLKTLADLQRVIDVQPPRGLGSFRVGSGNYRGVYRCGCVHAPTQNIGWWLVFRRCPEHPDQDLLCAEDTGHGGLTCESHGEVYPAYRVEAGSCEVDSTPQCPQCLVERHRPSPPADPEPRPAGHRCPLGKDPCQLNNPQCNVSPGLYVTTMHGRQTHICGDCLSQTGGEALAQARSIDRIENHV